MVVSDLMEEPESWLREVRTFAGRRTDFAAIQVADRTELGLSFDVPAIFVSPEDGSTLAVDPVGAAAEFSEVVEAFFNEVRGGIRQEGGRHILAWTDQPMDIALRRLIGGKG